MRRVRVLLAGENPTFIHAVTDFVSHDPGMEVVAATTTGPDTVRQAERLAPDIVVVDVVMPGFDGLEVTRRIKRAGNRPRVIVLSLDNNREYRAAAHRAGADGFLSKSDIGVSLLPTIRDLGPGGQDAAPSRVEEKQGESEPPRGSNRAGTSEPSPTEEKT